MFRMPICIVLGLCVVGLLTTPAVRAEEPNYEVMYQNILDRYSPALVAVKFVQKTQGRYGDYEGEEEITAVMVEPTGLVMCSNSQLGGGSRSRYYGRSIPTEIKVVVDDNTEGLPATFIARDTELDLAWLQIDKPGDRTFPCIDVAEIAKDPVDPHLGQRLLTMGRMGKYYGKVMLVTEGYIAGRTTKPRKLYVSRGMLDNDPGLPVFTEDGQVVGFEAIQRPNADEVSGDEPNLVTRGFGLLLPVETVAKATVRAKEILAQEKTEEAEAEAPVTGPGDGPDTHTDSQPSTLEP